MKCSVCNVDLEVQLVWPVEGDECPKCGRTWFEDDELRQAKDAFDVDLKWLDFELWTEWESLDLQPKELACWMPPQTQLYEAGVGYGTNTGPRGTFEIELRRLNRVGHRASGEVSASLIERRISTQYVIPVGVGEGNVLALAAGFARLTPSTSVSNAAIASATLGRHRGRWQEMFSLQTRRRRHWADPTLLAEVRRIRG